MTDSEKMLLHNMPGVGAAALFDLPEDARVAVLAKAASELDEHGCLSLDRFLEICIEHDPNRFAPIVSGSPFCRSFGWKADVT